MNNPITEIMNNPVTEIMNKPDMILVLTEYINNTLSLDTTTMMDVYKYLIDKGCVDEITIKDKKIIKEIIVKIINENNTITTTENKDKDNKIKAKVNKPKKQKVKSFNYNNFSNTLLKRCGPLVPSYSVRTGDSRRSQVVSDAKQMKLDSKQSNPPILSFKNNIPYLTTPIIQPSTKLVGPDKPKPLKNTIPYHQSKFTPIEKLKTFDSTAKAITRIDYPMIIVARNN